MSPMFTTAASMRLLVAWKIIPSLKYFTMNFSAKNIMDSKIQFYKSCKEYMIITVFLYKNLIYTSLNLEKNSNSKIIHKQKTLRVKTYARTTVRVKNPIKKKRKTEKYIKTSLQDGLLYPYNSRPNFKCMSQLLKFNYRFHSNISTTNFR